MQSYLNMQIEQMYFLLLYFERCYQLWRYGAVHV